MERARRAARAGVWLLEDRSEHPSASSEHLPTLSEHPPISSEHPPALSEHPATTPQLRAWVRDARIGEAMWDGGCHHAPPLQSRFLGRNRLNRTQQTSENTISVKKKTKTKYLIQGSNIPPNSWRVASQPLPQGWCCTLTGADSLPCKAPMELGGRGGHKPSVERSGVPPSPQNPHGRAPSVSYGSASPIAPLLPLHNSRHLAPGSLGEGCSGQPQ